MAIPAGLEPATSRLEGECSIQLSYGTEQLISPWLLGFFWFRNEFYRQETTTDLNRTSRDVLGKILEFSQRIFIFCPYGRSTAARHSMLRAARAETDAVSHLAPCTLLGTTKILKSPINYAAVRLRSCDKARD
jgi:hypothetical protein